MALRALSPASLLGSSCSLLRQQGRDRGPRGEGPQGAGRPRTAEADQKKAIAEAKAREDAERSATPSAPPRRPRPAKEKEDKYNAEMAGSRPTPTRRTRAREQYSKQVSELTIELDNLHKQKDALTREAFELAKKIELAEVARRMRRWKSSAIPRCWPIARTRAS
jgi:hypothetical protein